MLSEKSAATVRATLPAVAGAIQEITTDFYDRLFTAHPELLRDLFNRGNQADGSQQRALAGAIAAFASWQLEHPDSEPAVLLDRIAHKHASLAIRPGQYEVVHTHLFAAIASVLGDAVTEDVAAAWSEVYWLMADALVAREKSLYAEAGAQDGDTWRDYRVLARHRETEEATTFVVAPADGSALPAFRPGQYVSVRVTLADGARQIRQYSLSGLPEGALQFTVRHVTATGGAPEGEVSAHLHRHVGAGDVLGISHPFGDVFLDEGDGPLLFASAGIGCTPIAGMLAHLAEHGSTRETLVLHADRHESAHALRADAEQLVAKLPHATAHVWYEEPESPRPADRTGRMDLEGLPVPADVTAYLCGPLPFLRSVRTQLLERGVPASRIRYEVFGPDLVQA